MDSLPTYENRFMKRIVYAKVASTRLICLLDGCRFRDMPVHRAATISSKEVRREQAFVPFNLKNCPNFTIQTWKFSF